MVIAVSNGIRMRSETGSCRFNEWKWVSNGRLMIGMLCCVDSMDSKKLIPGKVQDLLFLDAVEFVREPTNTGAPKTTVDGANASGTFEKSEKFTGFRGRMIPLDPTKAVGAQFETDIPKRSGEKN